VTGPFVPAGYVPPDPPRHEEFRLEPLGPEHNERDHDAWMSSIEHIRSTPGFPMEDGWPFPVSLQDNLVDLRAHAEDFATGRGFTYSVLSADAAEVIGCVYVYPDPRGRADAVVRSWVRSSHARLDEPLWRTVSAWLEDDWPFDAIDYVSRAG
jgi:hypothetical protein